MHLCLTQPVQALSDEEAKTILDDMEHLGKLYMGELDVLPWPTPMAKYSVHSTCLAVQWCSSLAEDWWSYEVCYKKSVRQVHFEGGKLTEEYSLGVYDNTTAPVFVPVRVFWQWVTMGLTPSTTSMRLRDVAHAIKNYLCIAG